MTASSIDALHNHWKSLREGNLPPFRSEISPRSLPDMLDNLFIFETLNPDDIRVRIAGIKICEMMGREVRGQTPMSFFGENARGRFAAVMTDVLTRPTVARLGLETSDSNGNIGHADMILLPLRSDFGDVSRIIGCVSEPDTGFTAPVSFHIKTIDLEGNARTPKSVPEVGFAEESAGFILDGAPVFRSISGNPLLKPAKVSRKQDYIKVVS